MFTPETLPPELKPIIKLFINRLPERLQSISQALNDEDWETVSHVAHQLKGTAANLGFEATSHISGKLEAEAKETRRRQLADQFISELKMEEKHIRDLPL